MENRYTLIGLSDMDMAVLMLGLQLVRTAIKVPAPLVSQEFATDRVNKLAEIGWVTVHHTSRVGMKFEPYLRGDHCPPMSEAVEEALVRVFR